jgi:hypothetical protein
MIFEKGYSVAVAGGSGRVTVALWQVVGGSDSVRVAVNGRGSQRSIDAPKAGSKCGSGNELVAVVAVAVDEWQM